ncbi:hypothetical protein TVAG_417820 [Trichomonas vaginalis G3]|uniref:Uncharacterized protein n=1 Tax=Trichomonas vaginalis (strain ATCC PRA-98 / G3) TaxID=412133 RepID=A2EDA2_TRIV3|nr:YVTN repeat-like/Quinoprotein amine dehydrogenase family [Trichomonas vaginalis G3]EAY09360.1 hypothetical protein TVAG_417820 [Trichomonas vaginalis G3]KAI5501704.1 YVTN repeat-like/Quinoprotein amine dehydrogenase family [Trichomonas vaginalis G3]|eukprot:XP_001321583.1 hypothetical protein [Trichomonas vaginalis G3]
MNEDTERNELIKEIKKELRLFKDITAKIQTLGDNRPAENPFKLYSYRKYENPTMTVTLEASKDIPHQVIKYKYIQSTSKIVFATERCLYICQIPIIYTPVKITLTLEMGNLVDFAILDTSSIIVCQLDDGSVFPFLMKEWGWGNKMLTSTQNIQICSSKSHFMLIEQPNSVYISDSTFHQIYNNHICSQQIVFGQLSKNGEFACFYTDTNEILVFSISTLQIIHTEKANCQSFSFSNDDKSLLVQNPSTISVFSLEKNSFVYAYDIKNSCADFGIDFYTVLGQTSEMPRKGLIFVDMNEGKLLSHLVLNDEDIIDFTSELSDVYHICMRIKSNTFVVFKIRLGVPIT